MTRAPAASNLATVRCLGAAYRLAAHEPIEPRRQQVHLLYDRVGGGGWG